MNTPIRGPSVKDSDTPRSNESASFQDVTQKIDHKQSEGSTKEESQKSNLKEVTVVKWVDYSKKYGIAYQLSNGSIGVLYNDETKIVYNPYYDKTHYFNGLDMLMFSFDEFSTKPLSEYSNDLRKKVKILSYLKKLLKTDEAQVSLTHKREANMDDTVVYLKKWSRVDNKTVFKLNSKLMQIIK